MSTFGTSGGGFSGSYIPPSKNEQMIGEEHEAREHLNNVLGRYIEPEDLEFAGFDSMDQAVEAFVHFNPEDPRHQTIRDQFDESLRTRAAARQKVRKPGITPQEIRQKESQDGGDLNFFGIPGATYSRSSDNLLGADDSVMYTYLRDANFINEITGRGHLKNKDGVNALDRLGDGDVFDEDDDGSPQEHGFSHPSEKVFSGMSENIDNENFSLNPTHEDLDAVGLRVPEVMKEGGSATTRFNAFRTANQNYREAVANPGKTATPMRTFTPQQNILGGENIGNTAYTKNMQGLDLQDTMMRAMRMDNGWKGYERLGSEMDVPDIPGVGDGVNAAIQGAVGFGQNVGMAPYYVLKGLYNYRKAAEEQNNADWAASSANSMSPVVPKANAEGREAFIDHTKEAAQLSDVKSAKQFAGENGYPVSNAGVMASELGGAVWDVPTIGSLLLGVPGAITAGIAKGGMAGAKAAFKAGLNSIKDEVFEPGNIPYGVHVAQEYGPDVSEGAKGWKDWVEPSVPTPQPGDTWTTDKEANNELEAKAQQRIRTLRSNLK
ncbi:MAG: hypothetical protein ACR2NI_09740 [Pirellulales bacterium]